MSLQVQLQKTLNQFNFLTTTPIEKHDLTNFINPNDRLVVRQGDLVITDYWINNCRRRGLRGVYFYDKNKIHRVLDSHVIIPLEGKTVLLHPEHGITIIPRPVNELAFYTFRNGGD